MFRFMYKIKCKIEVSRYLFFKLALLPLISLFAIILTEDNKNVNQPVGGKKPDATERQYAAKSFNQLPIRFEKNMGQAGEEADFLYRDRLFAFQMTGDRVTMSLNRQTQKTKAKKVQQAPVKVTMQLFGANPEAKAKGLDKLITISNYFLGNDPNRWLTKIPNYQKVHYAEIYPGIDLVYYGQNGKLEFDFEVSPGFDPDVIVLKFAEETDVKLDDDGSLVVQASGDSITLLAPQAYQDFDGTQTQVAAHFISRDDHTFGFEVGAYDESIPLIIDPVIVYSTFLKSSWKGEDIAVDQDGFAYITGSDYNNVFAIKLHPDSSAMIYSTLFGGDLDDFGLGIAVDTAGCAYITGETQSDNFPTKNAIQPNFGGMLWVDGDAFVTKLSKDGSAFVYSTYLGGEIEDIGHDIAVDLAGNAYVTGETNSSNFPVKDAYQETRKNYEHEAFVTKLNADGSDYVFSTFLGGNGDEEGRGIALDAEQNIYLTGQTWSLDFPTTAGAYQTNAMVGDAFVAKMNAQGTDLIFSTYLTGGNDPNSSNVDWGTGIAVNSIGEVYIVGKTWSPDFPTVNAIQENNAGNLDGFVTKFKADGSALLFSTYLGGAGFEDYLKIVLDAEGKAYITGQTTSENFPTANPIQDALKGHVDAFVSAISADGKELFFSTYLGGGGWEFGRGIAMAANAHIFITGHADSDDFPLVSPLPGTMRSGFVTEISFDDTDIVWKNITARYSLPGGIRVFEGTRVSPKLKAFYIDADLNRPELSVRPYIRGTKESVQDFNNIVGAYASVNGGFFWGGKSNSAVIYPNDVKAKNVATLRRNSKSYPVIRGLFGMKKDRSFSVDWIYHFGNYVDEIFTFTKPLPYTRNDPNPKSAPSPNDGSAYSDLLTGVGGGPVLIKNGAIKVTYDEEILWDSGVAYDKRDPRTAVGYTADKHVIMLVADGRSTQSEGVGLPELAEIMSNLGCVEALNLDGGGSSQMAIGNAFVNTPSEIRDVPSILSIVHTDSLNLDEAPVLELYYDTDGANIETVGNWTESTTPGAYGDSNALIIPAGVGNNYIKYNLELGREADYEVYAWWVSAPDRCQDAPYVISHVNGTDTVRIDQSENGSFWHIIGNYAFSGTNSDFVKITDGGTTGGSICADAIRIVSSDRITGIERQATLSPDGFRLKQNYPNPFNPSTTIAYSLDRAGFVELRIYDLLGRKIRSLVREYQPAGAYSTVWDGKDDGGMQASSGSFLYELRVGELLSTKKMLFLK